MAGGLYDEIVYGLTKIAFAAEYEAEEHEEAGPMDGVYDEDDLGPVVKRRRLHDEDENMRTEDLEENVPIEVEDMVMEQEKKRRQEWLKLPRAKRLAVRRLHTMTGHCSNSALVRMLRSSASDADVVKAAKHFQCQTCQETEKDKDPAVVRPTRPSFQQKFNFEVSLDVFEVHDCQGGRHAVLSMVDTSTKFHVAVRVGDGGTPKSKVCAEAINGSWFAWAGPPKHIVVDQGVHNKGRVIQLLQSNGVNIRQVGVAVPYQQGTGERHGGTFS